MLYIPNRVSTNGFREVSCFRRLPRAGVPAKFYTRGLGYRKNAMRRRERANLHFADARLRNQNFAVANARIRENSLTLTENSYVSTFAPQIYWKHSNIYNKIAIIYNLGPKFGYISLFDPKFHQAFRLLNCSFLVQSWLVGAFGCEMQFFINKFPCLFIKWSPTG